MSCSSPLLDQSRNSDVLQVDQEDLGVSGGLAGVARNGGGVVALTVCTTILTNVQASTMKKLVPAAVASTGLPPTSVDALLSALPLGEAALSKVPGLTTEALEAALSAFQQSFVVALRYVFSNLCENGTILLHRYCFTWILVSD